MSRCWASYQGIWRCRDCRIINRPFRGCNGLPGELLFSPKLESTVQALDAAYRMVHDPSELIRTVHPSILPQPPLRFLD